MKETLTSKRKQAIRGVKQLMGRREDREEVAPLPPDGSDKGTRRGG